MAASESRPASRLARIALRAGSRLTALVPVGSGQGRLALALYRTTVAGSDRTKVVRLKPGARFELDLSDRLQAIACLTRNYEVPLLRFITGQLRTGDTFIDVGAHVGLVSLCVAAARPDVSVHAFEPDPRSAQSLRDNLALNPSIAVELNEAALGPELGLARLIASPDPLNRALSRVVMGRHEAPDDSLVPMLALDDYLDELGVERVGVVKLDVEGFEASVIEGAARAIEDGRIGCVVAEVYEPWLERYGSSGHDLHRLLVGLGLQPTQVPEVGLRRLLPRRAPRPADNVAFVRPPQRM